MTIQEFIETAIEGGFPAEIQDYPFNPCVVPDSLGLRVVCGWDVAIRYIVLDPKAWEAVGKVKGWDGGYPGNIYEDNESRVDDPQYHMTAMVIALCNNKTLEEFIAIL